MSLPVRNFIEEARQEYRRQARAFLLSSEDRIVWQAKKPPKWLGAIFFLAGIVMMVLAVLTLIGVLHADKDTSTGFTAATLTRGLLDLAGGVLFTLAGAWMIQGVNRFVLDGRTRTWRKAVGIPPFVRVKGGGLDTIHRIEFGKEYQAPSDFGGGIDATERDEVWVARLIFDAKHSPLILPFFRLPVSLFEREEAVELVTDLAARFGLTCQDETGALLTPSTTVRTAGATLSRAVDMTENESPSATLTIGQQGR